MPGGLEQEHEPVHIQALALGARKPAVLRHRISEWLGLRFAVWRRLGDWGRILLAA